MHPRIAELLEHLDRQRIVLRSAVDDVAAELRERSPGPEQWSVANVLEHLGLVESRLTLMFSTWFDEARTRGLAAEQETSSILGSGAAEKAVNRTFKIVSSERVRPNAMLDSESAWRKLEEGRPALRAAILSADGFALGEIVHPHPAFGPMDLYQWYAFIGWHEARHAAQVREIGSRLVAG